jgi:hypothetical protein
LRESYERRCETAHTRTLRFPSTPEVVAALAGGGLVAHIAEHIRYDPETWDEARAEWDEAIAEAEREREAEAWVGSYILSVLVVPTRLLS